MAGYITTQSKQGIQATPMSSLCISLMSMIHTDDIFLYIDLPPKQLYELGHEDRN